MNQEENMKIKITDEMLATLGVHIIDAPTGAGKSRAVKELKVLTFEFVKSLKAGGTGKTVLMRDTTINKQFVCKKYDPQQKEFEEEFYERFIDEIKIMYSIFNDNIVRIFDYYLYPDLKTGYIIMEYIQGQDIDEYFQANNKENINAIFV